MKIKHTNYFAQNSKMKKSTGEKVFNFGIPAFKSNTGLMTCPQAGICAKGCYAKQGTYIWSNVNKKYEERLALTLSDKFIYTLSAEIIRRKIKKVRIHDSGDFYSIDYINKWLEIIRLNPEVEFYAYTKMVSIFKNLEENNKIPTNLTIIYSYGGKQDNLINNEVDRHSKVFASEEELLSRGYINASQDDNLALTDNVKVGLIFHGAKSKLWTA